jgi:hypothetical protein
VSERDRQQRERRREEQIKAENLSARIRAADPVQRDQIDPSTGRTWGDAVARGLYDDDSRIRSFRDLAALHRQAGRQHSYARARARGWQGAN